MLSKIMARTPLTLPLRVTNYQVNEGINSLHALEDSVDSKFEKWYTGISERIWSLRIAMERLDSRDLRNLHARHDTHSAKLRELSKELEHVKLENEALREFVLENSGKGHAQAEPEGATATEPPGPFVEKYEKQEEGSIHDLDYDLAPDGKPRRYWGFNYFYTPQMATSKRWEDLQNFYNKIEDWKRRKQIEEEKWMKDKPKTYEYTGPYQEFNPPRDINKYFHDSKYMDSRLELPPADYYFNDDVPSKMNPALTTTYENTFISPRRPGNSQACGGLYFIRYHDSGHEEVTLALKGLQTVIHNSYKGCVMGMARKSSIFIVEGDGDWVYSKVDRTNPRIGFRHKLAENGLAVLWFPSLDQARGFFFNTFRNPFKEAGFPTSQGYEAFYVPLISSPLFKTLDTYLLIEFTNAKRLYKPEDMLGFEADAREEIYKIVPNSCPMVVSCLEGRESFKPGTFVKMHSKVYISRFNSQTDVAAVLNTEKLQALREKYNLTGPMNVTSFSLKDWRD